MDDNGYRSIAEAIQTKILKKKEALCQNDTDTEPQSADWCPKVWDGVLCWPSVPAGEVAVQECPHYIVGFDLEANATRECMENGQWFWHPEFNNTWTDYSGCYSSSTVMIAVDLPDLPDDNITEIAKYIPTIKNVATVGYGISLTTLLIAFLILANIKKLRCQRNLLHMHLFASFMVRALTFLLKDLIFIPGVGLSKNVVIKNGTSYWLPDKVETWHCKTFTSIWQYCILANYSWIFMEGLYLHNLIFSALFADPDGSIAMYVIIGWGLPALFLIPWVILRVLYEDTYCWTTHNNGLIFELIRIPIMVTVIVNFGLFVNIVRVLMSKLKSTIIENNLRYKRWARSTLVLVPLFGVHYFVFLGMSYGIQFHQSIEIAWLFGDQLFASFQGSFVAVLYCFLNTEVRTELSQKIRTMKWPRLPIFCHARPSTHSGSNCSCNTTGRHTHSDPSLYYCCCRLFSDCEHSTRHQHHRSNQSVASTQDVGITTRDGSLASSKGYLDVAECGTNMALCKNMNQSSLSFCSNLSETENCSRRNLSTTDKCGRRNSMRDDPDWSDSDCCNTAYELHHLQQHGYP